VNTHTTHYLTNSHTSLHLTHCTSLAQCTLSPRTLPHSLSALSHHAHYLTSLTHTLQPYTQCILSPHTQHTLPQPHNTLKQNTPTYILSPPALQPTLSPPALQPTLSPPALQLFSVTHSPPVPRHGISKSKKKTTLKRMSKERRKL